MKEKLELHIDTPEPSAPADTTPQLDFSTDDNKSSETAPPPEDAPQLKFSTEGDKK